MSKKLNIEFIRAEFAKESYILLTTAYDNAHQKLEYICPNGHQRFIAWANWQQNQRCPCFSNQMKPTIEYIRADFAKEGYILLTEVYEGNKQKLEYICSGPERHKHSTSWGNWIQGGRCPFCNSNNNISKWEKTVKSFLNELNIDYIPNNRTQIVNPKTGCNLELDIWFPNLNKVIECNGLYWHSKSERKECDKIKQQLCKDQNIDLLVITDKEWNSNVEKCQADVLSF